MTELTIVIPVKDRAHTLPRTLRSVAEQTLRPLDVVIVDNGSGDDSAGLAAAWCDAVAPLGIRATLLHEPTPGAAAARNRGLAAVTTPYVMFFDSDDMMLPGHTRRIADFFAANPTVDLLGFDIACRDSDGWTTYKAVADTNLMRGHILHSSFATQRFAAATELVRAAGGWNEELAAWDDLELGVRLLLNSASTAMVHGDSGVIVYHTEDSITAAGYAANLRSMELAVEEMERSLRARGREEDLAWTAAKRMVLGAMLRREGAAGDARRIEAPALAAAKTFRKKLTLRLAGASVRITGRGGCAIATMLMPCQGSVTEK